ncbi:hypothetical protein BH23ACT9_BH23ACT9_01480 [soil metagenome]
MTAPTGRLPDHDDTPPTGMATLADAETTTPSSQTPTGGADLYGPSPAASGPSIKRLAVHALLAAGLLACVSLIGAALSVLAPVLLSDCPRAAACADRAAGRVLRYAAIAPLVVGGAVLSAGVLSRRLGLIWLGPVAGLITVLLWGAVARFS